jgi:hypothetical protein
MNNWHERIEYSLKSTFPDAVTGAIDAIIQKCKDRAMLQLSIRHGEIDRFRYVGVYGGNCLIWGYKNLTLANQAIEEITEWRKHKIT